MKEVLKEQCKEIFPWNSAILVGRRLILVHVNQGCQPCPSLEVAKYDAFRSFFGLPVSHLTLEIVSNDSQEETATAATIGAIWISGKRSSSH